MGTTKDPKKGPQPITAEETDLNVARTRALDPREASRVYREAVPKPQTAAAPVPYDPALDEETMAESDDTEWPTVSLGSGVGRIQLHTRGVIKVTVDGKRVPAGRVMVVGLDATQTHAVVAKSADGRVTAMEVKMKGSELVTLDLD